MLDQFVPTFDEQVFEGYNAKIPDDINAFKNLDSFLKQSDFKRRAMPTAVPEQRRFVYWNGDKRVIVTTYYAGKDIQVEIPGIRTEASLTQTVLPDFIDTHLMSYIGKKSE